MALRSRSAANASITLRKPSQILRAVGAAILTNGFACRMSSVIVMILCFWSCGIAPEADSIFVAANVRNRAYEIERGRE
jgi:hypothetical protein